MASHATTKEESPTIVERFRKKVFAYVTGAQVSNLDDVPRPGLRGPRPGLHEAVCRIICSRRHNLKPCRKRRSGSECASAPRKRDESRMFLFAWRRTESAGSSTSGGKEPFPGLGGHGQTELQPGDIESPPAKPTLAELDTAEIPAFEAGREVADIPPVGVQADPAEAMAIS